MDQDISIALEADLDDPDHNERGAVLAITVGSIVVLLAMAAFSVDVGWIFLNKARAQRAADAAALAGVVYLPAEPANAKAEALDVADINGYVAGGGVSVTATQPPGEDRRLKVEITDTEVPLFFMRVFGYQTATIAADATAEYVIPVPLGSPEDKFGADPTDPAHDFDAVGFWAAIQHQTGRKPNGDPYATTCYESIAPYTGCNGLNGEFYGLDSESEANGYWYAVEVPTGTTDFAVEIFDAGPVRENTSLRPVENSRSQFSGNNEIQQVRHDHTTGDFRLMWDGQTSSSIQWNAAANEVANALETMSGINNVQVTRTENLPEIVWEIEFIDPGFVDVADLAPGLNTLAGGTFFDTSELTAGGALFSGRTVYRLHAPDGTPFNYRDNVVISACDKAYEAGSIDLTDQVWTTLCSFSGSPTPGIYPLRVFTDGPMRSHNAYSLKVTGNPPAGEQLRIFALDTFSISSTVEAGASRFYLAEIVEVHAGKQLVIELFDPGDVSGSGANWIRLIHPDGTIWDNGCVIEESENPIGAPVYLPHETITGECSISADRTNSFTDYQADWIKITTELPGDYSCDHISGPEPDCWWEIEYFYTTQASERTTWRASVPGSLVSLVFEGP
ncbi:MAG: pilus assembly protein TadG-related protein [Acidimicrobiia bacterium]|nr:pilus assembly protein TadG-related protein [Acidimicrobiia bacterium]MDH3470576.1 pilus assembly protein TadG-related protein [Acidimicrobiia bacterium]